MTITELVDACAESNLPTTRSEIQSLQKLLRIRFPEDYISYLLEQNGGFFRNILIKTPWHPLSGDRLESIYHVDSMRVERSWESSPGEADEYDLDDAVGCIQSVLLFQHERPIRYLPVASTLLGHLIVMEFTDGQFHRVIIKGAFIDVPVFYCDSFEMFIDKYLEKM